MPAAYDKLVDRLQSRSYEGLELSTREYEDESHMSCVLRSLLDGVAFLYSGASLAVIPDGVAGS